MLAGVRTFALFLLLVSVGVLPASASARTVLLGRSWEGRPIVAVEVGNPAGTPVLVVGCIHGEAGGIAIADALERLSPRDLDLWIVPVLNPDGVAADTRQTRTASTLTATFPGVGGR
jgi:protein MpaA